MVYEVCAVKNGRMRGGVLNIRSRLMRGVLLGVD